MFCDYYFTLASPLSITVRTVRIFAKSASLTRMLNKCRVAGLRRRQSPPAAPLKCRIQLIALFAALYAHCRNPRKNKYLPSVHYPLLGRVLIVRPFISLIAAMWIWPDAATLLDVIRFSPSSPLFTQLMKFSPTSRIFVLIVFALLTPFINGFSLAIFVWLCLFLLWVVFIYKLCIFEKCKLIEI